MNRLIAADRSLIVAMDVDFDQAGEVALALRGQKGIGAFKTGIVGGYDQGLENLVDTIRANYGEDAVIIHDHQKAGNDIPDMGAKYATVLKNAGCNGAILFPFAGPETQRRWTDKCQEVGLVPIVGAVMTHVDFLESEGGYISDVAPRKIIEIACSQGVRDFVVPGTKLDWVQMFRQQLDDALGVGGYALQAPGFITQGGDITECGRAAGPRFHPIVGSAIYEKRTERERRKTAALLVTKLLAA